jgi:alpha-mannosidase
MTPTEQKIRARLGVPADANSVLLLGMDAHMDWDWLNTFQTLVFTGNGDAQGSVQDIIQQAWNLMSQNQGATAPYLYSVCEMGFLRAALTTNPALLTQFQQDNLAQQLSIEGGGITSPDNLLPHGEAFVRNYLAGWAWEMATLGLPAIYAYLPDDFGHDAQLPVMLQAMGLPAVSFSRMPGSWASSQTQPLDGSQSLYQQLMTQGADFVWQASDGSSVLAHLEQHSYSQGNSLHNDCSDPKSALPALAGMLSANQPSSPTPYVYLPCGNDFALPIPCLLDIATAWNQTQYSTTGTWVAVGTLAQYTEMVQAWSGANPGKLVSRPFDATPYWTGFYASRPANKILHQATVRALLGAEVFGAIADLLQTADDLAWAPVQTARQQAVAQGWEALLPSTHHDYITGTAVDSVYTEEQLPLLTAAHTIALGHGARPCRKSRRSSPPHPRRARRRSQCSISSASPATGWRRCRRRRE